MDKKFLNKVVDQLVSESVVDFEKDRVTYPVELSINIFYETPFASYGISSQFVRHCEEVYGLKPDEIKYVWREYKNNMKSEDRFDG
jgi:hypothetical protein